MQIKKWRDAMGEEIQEIRKNDTWDLADLPKYYKEIVVKWVYKAKKNAKREVERYKTRLVVKVYKQRASIDYDEVFAPVACLNTIRFIISIESSSRRELSGNIL